MSGDIEEFLRRAAQRRQAQAQGRGPAPQPVAPAPPTRSMRPALTQMPSTQTSDVIDADIVEAEPVSGDDVAEYVSQHLSNRSFTERAQHFGEDTRKSEASLESEVEQHFRKPLKPVVRGRETLVSEGSQAAVASTAAIEPRPVGDELQNMFRSPANIRLAFILGEVLTRPADHW